MAPHDDQTRRFQQLAELWTAAQPTVAAFIGSMVRDYHAAEDLLQKTASTLVAKFDEYDPARPFVKWAIGVARFEVLNHLRRGGRAGGHELSMDAGALDALAGAYERIADELPERKQALARCLAQTPAKARRMLELCYGQNLAPADVAQRLGTTANATRVQLHRIRAALRDCIQRRLAGEATR